MGFLSRLFGPPPKRSEQSISLNGLDTFSVKVVGESHYQDNLSKICGGFTKEGIENIATAKLVHADDNPYDNKAIRIEISGMTVGYLSRSEARYFRDQMRANGYVGLTANCKAKITGGWDRGINDVGNFGVSLDLPIEYIESISNNVRITDNLVLIAETDTFLFSLEKCQPEELAQCHIGDYVNFWVPKDSLDKVYVFRCGSVGGTGRIGCVPSKDSRNVATHLNSGLKCETEIIEINANKSLCKIKCRLIRKEETVAKQKADFEVISTKLRTELQSKYTPRVLSLVTKIQLPKNHHLVEGQELFLENKPIDYYVQNAMRLSVNFVDNNGVIVAQKSYETKIILTLLRAFFNKYTVKICIKKIDKPGEYTLKYIEFIEAQVQVSFGDG